jgi:hypothetical protein
MSAAPSAAYWLAAQRLKRPSSRNHVRLKRQAGGGWDTVSWQVAKDTWHFVGKDITEAGARRCRRSGAETSDLGTQDKPLTRVGHGSNASIRPNDTPPSEVHGYIQLVLVSPGVP